MSKGLELLKFNHAGAFLHIDGHSENYGVIEVDSEKLEYYTGKGLREMWSPNMSEEQKRIAEKLKLLSREEQIEQGLRNVIKLSEISRVLF